MATKKGAATGGKRASKKKAAGGGDPATLEARLAQAMTAAAKDGVPGAADIADALNPPEDHRGEDDSPEDEAPAPHPLEEKAAELRDRFVSFRDKIATMSRDEARVTLGELAAVGGAVCGLAHETLTKHEQENEALVKRIENLENDRDALAKADEKAGEEREAQAEEKRARIEELETEVKEHEEREKVFEADIKKLEDTNEPTGDQCRDVIALLEWGLAAGAQYVDVQGSLLDPDFIERVDKLARGHMASAGSRDKPLPLGFVPPVDPELKAKADYALAGEVAPKAARKNGGTAKAPPSRSDAMADF